VSRRSLRLRLSLAGGLLVVLALFLAGIGLTLIFDRVLDKRTADELTQTANLLVGQLRIEPDGSPAIGVTPADPRFRNPYGGLYWQVETPAGPRLRSRSLWDKALALPVSDANVMAQHRVVELPGPDDGRLLTVVQSVEITQPGVRQVLTVVVALDRKELAESRTTFLWLIVPSLAGLALVLTAALAFFVHIALRPFHALRANLQAVHDGHQSRLPQHYPDEVQPLVDDLNHMIGFQEMALERAKSHSADMAHGMKTPLAVLGALSRRNAADMPEISGELDQQIALMERQVHRTLANVRVAAAGGLVRRRFAVAPVVHRLVTALGSLPRGATLDWQVEIPTDFSLSGDEGDLTELLGNLLDNARKWAGDVVTVSGSSLAGQKILVIEDDGSGMTEVEMQGIGRGKRWDEAQPGTGLGLAIAIDLARAIHLEIAFGRASLGGLRVTLTET
jgi:signal transduction histidine kinase